MEEVDDDLVDLNAFRLIPPGHLQHLILGAVTQFALPQAHQVLREYPGPTGDGGVFLQNCLGRIGGSDPVVHLMGGLGDPFIVIPAEGHPPHCRIVPQEAIPQGGHSKGNGYLRIALGQLQNTALQVHALLLVLAHTEDFLAFIALKFVILENTHCRR